MCIKYVYVKDPCNKDSEMCKYTLVNFSISVIPRKWAFSFTLILIADTFIQSHLQ